MKGNEMSDFAFARELRAWLAEEESGEAPVSLRIRISTGIRREAESSRHTGMRDRLAALLRPLRLYADLAGLTAIVAAVAMIAGLNGRIAEATGAPVPEFPGSDAPGTWPGIVNSPWPGAMPPEVFAGILVASAVAAWIIASARVFRTAGARVLAFGSPNREDGRIVPYTSRIPWPAAAVAAAILCAHAYWLSQSGQPDVLMTSIDLAVGGLDALAVFFLLTRHRRLWRSDPLLVVGFVAYVGAVISGAALTILLSRFAGILAPSELLEAASLIAGLGLLGFGIGLARRNGLRRPPARVPTALGAVAGIAYTFSANLIYPVGDPEHVAVQLLFGMSVAGGWLLALWAVSNAFAAGSAASLRGTALLGMACVSQVGLLAYVRLAVLFPEQLAGSAATAPAIAYPSRIETILTIAGALFIAVAFAIGLPRAEVSGETARSSGAAGDTGR